MIDQELLAAIVGFVGVALVVLLSLPALKHCLSNLIPRPSTPAATATAAAAVVEDSYQDEDGIATEKSLRAYTDLRPRVFLWLSLAAGLAASIASRVLLAKNGYPALEPRQRAVVVPTIWLEVSLWGLVCFQASCLPLRNRYSLKFHLTVCGLLSSLILAACVAVRDAFPALVALAHHHVEIRAYGALCLAQLAAALAVAASFAAFPRRPDVYHDGHLVDQQKTLSLLALFSYSWNHILFTIPKERQMKLVDMPVLDYKTRSRNLQAHFLAKSGKGRLWRQLIRVYSYELAIQWLLTLVIAFLALFPQLVLYKFLQRIETRADSLSVDPALFAWVLGLLLSQLLQIGVYSWLRWITNSRLDTPVLSLLQSLVFSKALKQYETATPGQRNEDKEKKDDKNPASSKGSKDGTASGKDEKKAQDVSQQSVINHMKLDSNRVTIFCQYNNNFPQSIFKLILAGSFLIRLLGWKSTLAGLGSACLIVPLSTRMSNRYGKLHFSLMKYRDTKAHLLTEALQGMRQIKYSALEQHWEDKILASRNEELKQYWRVSLWQCVLVFIINLGPLLLACVAFSVYAWENGINIKASVIFTSLGLFDQLDEAVALLPLLQMYLVEAWTSCVRLENYFSQPDKGVICSPGDSIQLENATVSWPKAGPSDEGLAAGDQAESHSMLNNISLSFPTEKLSVITGKTGSGKSLLLAAILGEVKLLSGNINVPTPPPASETAPTYIPASEWVIPSLAAFVSQTPWIESGTVEENITFGLPFDQGRYQQVLHACALERDIELLIDGDLTQVGPKGVTLSGGQRWRVALARALYSRAGIIILDDVLSAVDAHVGRLIVDEALAGQLAKGRTRILATHHAELVLPRASYLVRLEQGRLESAEALSPSADDALDAAEAESTATLVLDNGARSDSETDEPAVNGLFESKQNKKKKIQKGGDSEEEREIGRVKWKVYKEYYHASGAAFYWLFGIGLVVVVRLLPVARTWALKELSERVSPDSAPKAFMQTEFASSQVYFHQTGANSPEYRAAAGSEREVAFWMGAYVVLYLLGNVATVLRVLALLVVGLRAARVLFQRLTHTILRAPLRWIDTVPSGRILNRFTSDTFTIDRRLAGETFGVIQNIFGLFIIVGTSLSVSVYVILFGLALLIFYARIANEYVGAAREMKRINSTSHSPIYDQFSSVLSGLPTIRAFGRADFYMNRMFRLIDDNAKADWALQIATRWMTFRMGALGAVFVTVVASAVALGGVDAALAGFSLTFALRYTSALTTLLQSMTSVELGYNAAERVLEYAEIQTEPEGGNDAPAAWPAEGRIEIDNVSVSYAEDLPDVLKDINFTVEPGERIGVVGRTGAGKSTLAAVLFRLLDPKRGSVRIDNIDISTLKLAHLRSRLAIIPQDPFLFSGTLRSNLDMEEKLEDYELHQALQRVHLVKSEPDAVASPRASPPPAGIADETPAEESAGVEEQPDEVTPLLSRLDPQPDTSDPQTSQSPSNTNIFSNLSHPISTGGLNLSQGQRQLCCLARALLARPKVVVLDEATSAVDRATDAAIQTSLRSEFTAAGCTVFVVAHRLSTVADFDRLLVLDGGRVAEMGSPRELLLAGMERDRATAATAATGARDEGSATASPDESQIVSFEEVGGEGAARSAGDAGSDSTQLFDNGDEGSDAPDGTGAFWDLVQKSAEKDKLVEMILG